MLVPLARALRKRFKRDGQYPKRKFQCVNSDELLENKGHNATCGTEQCMCPKAKIGPGDPTLLNHEWCSSKAQINGTLAHITAIFGFMLAGLVIQDAVNTHYFLPFYVYFCAVRVVITLSICSCVSLLSRFNNPYS